MKRAFWLVCALFFAGCAGNQSDLYGNDMNPTATQALETAPIPPPMGLRLQIVPGGIHLTWQPPIQGGERVIGYEIVRATMLSGPYSAVGKVASQLDFTDTSAAAEHIYYYRVRALTASGGSELSTPVTAEISGM